MKPSLFDVRHLLKSYLYVKVLRCRNLNDQFHFHNAFEIALILRGNGRRIVGDHVDTFTDGDLTIMAPNLPHASYSAQKYHIKKSSTNVHALVVYFQPDWIDDLRLNPADFALIRELLNQISRGIRITGKTHAAVVNYLLELRNMDGARSFIILLQILDTISRSKDYKCLASAGYSSTYDEHSIRRIHDVYRYVMENFPRKIALKDIGAIAHMTSSAFCKYFKTRTNKTFTHFVNEIRINYARELIMNQNLEISTICFQCGFNNFTTFNKNFKHFTKVTPSEYRARFLRLPK